LGLLCFLANGVGFLGNPLPFFCEPQPRLPIIVALGLLGVPPAFLGLFEMVIRAAH